MTFEEAYKILGYKPSGLVWMDMKHYQAAVIASVDRYTDGGTKPISYQDKERTRAEIEFMA